MVGKEGWFFFLTAWVIPEDLLLKNVSFGGNYLILKSCYLIFLSHIKINLLMKLRFCSLASSGWVRFSVKWLENQGLLFEMNQLTQQNQSDQFLCFMYSNSLWATSQNSQRGVPGESQLRVPELSDLQLPGCPQGQWPLLPRWPSHHSLHVWCTLKRSLEWATSRMSRLLGFFILCYSVCSLSLEVGWGEWTLPLGKKEQMLWYKVWCSSMRLRQRGGYGWIMTQNIAKI